MKRKTESGGSKMKCKSCGNSKEFEAIYTAHTTISRSSEGYAESELVCWSGAESIACAYCGRVLTSVEYNQLKSEMIGAK
jgi:hypothetical protein